MQLSVEVVNTLSYIHQGRGGDSGSKFTNYRVSSSVIRRNQQLSLLDDKFDKFMDQYDEAEEGALEGEEIEGCVEETSVRMSDLMAEHEREKALRRQQLERGKVIQKLSLLDRCDSEEEVDIVKVADKGLLISEPRNNKIQLSSKTSNPKSKTSELSIRPKHETPEEKKDRTTNLKQARRERRAKGKKKPIQANSKSEKMRQ